jgi:LemA protein
MKNLKLGFVAVIVAVLFSSCGYNKMVSMDEQVTSQWAQV